MTNRMPAEVMLVTPFSQTHYVVPPIGLGYLATALEKNGISAAIIDGIKLKMSEADFIRLLADNAPLIIGFQVFSCDVARVKKYIQLVRLHCPQSSIILGGAHPSGVGGRIFDDFPDADYAFHGEAEAGLPLLCARLLERDKRDPLETISGLIWRDADGRTVVNPKTYCLDLDALGFPAWHLLEPQSYPEEPQGGFCRQYPFAPISTSRGCPYPCTYCAGNTITGSKIRLRSVGHVIQEIEMLYTRYGIREFHIIDDTFTSDRSRVLAFCALLAARNLKISYAFPNGVRLNTLDREMLVRMKETGLYSLTVGVESGSQRILDAMQKQLTLELIEEKVQLISSIGLKPGGFFLIGFPGETRADIEQTIRFALRLPLQRAHFSNFLPLPGTAITRRLEQEQQLGQVAWDDLFYARVPYAPAGLTKASLKELQRQAFLAFYLRPRIILDLLASIRSLRHLKGVAVRARDYIFKKR